MPGSKTVPFVDHEEALRVSDLLPQHPVFRATDLESASNYLTRVLAPHRLNYTTRARDLNFRHRVAKLGDVELNALQFGGDVMVVAPDVPEFYLLQFMLSGSCRLMQAGETYDMTAGTVAIINPRRPFTKAWSVDGRQLLIRIERAPLDHELRAWTARDQRSLIEFDRAAFTFERAGAVTHLARMLCNAFGERSSQLDHPLLRDRLVSALASGLLLGLPHNYSEAIATSGASIAPACVRRAELFMVENLRQPIGLAGLALAAGLSARGLQMAFRRFRDTTPMARLRALRLEMARSDLTRADPEANSVACIATACGFSHLSRFATDYRARFNERPSDTLRRRRPYSTRKEESR